MCTQRTRRMMPPMLCVPLLRSTRGGDTGGEHPVSTLVLNQNGKSRRDLQVFHQVYGPLKYAIRNKCIAISNRCLITSNKKPIRIKLNSIYCF